MSKTKEQINEEIEKRRTSWLSEEEVIKPTAEEMEKAKAEMARVREWVHAQPWFKEKHEK
ncbi:MAG: hypothetical protein VKN72_04825 [Nostocales cyanobacterium 94392]|nr:hypothetical protein [Nostocales cyanobacterium 94392]